MWNDFFKHRKVKSPQDIIVRALKEMDAIQNRKINSLQEFQEWKKEMDEKLQVIKDEQKIMDVIAFSEHQVKDFANWCIRETVSESVFKKWVKEGPDFIFKEWKKNRKL